MQMICDPHMFKWKLSFFILTKKCFLIYTVALIDGSQHGGLQLGPMYYHTKYYNKILYDFYY